MLFNEAGAVRAILDGDKRLLEVLAAPFGSFTKQDRLGQWLSARTNFMIGIGDRRPVLYMHGRSPRNRDMQRPTAIGTAVVSKIDEQGLWMTTELDGSELSTRAWEAAKIGQARASTGSVNYLVRPQDRKAKGEVEVWPIAELSIWDIANGMQPVSDDAIVLPLRAIFNELNLEMPEAFQAGEATNIGNVELPLSILSTTGGHNKMSTEIQQAVAEALAAQTAANAAEAAKEVALRAKIEAEMKADPKYRSVFAINKITGDKGLPAEKQETFAYVHALRMAGLNRDPGAFRVLEESEATEGGPMVPADMLNQIWAKRGVYSLVRKSGMPTLVSDKLTFNIPAENTAMAISPTVAEEANYVANEPAFATRAITLLKKGDMVTVTEELLEDQSLFQSWFVGAAGRSIGLAENLVLFDAINVQDGVEIGAAGAPTVAEFDAKYFALGQQYRDGAVWITNDATIGYIRGLLVATPRAYGSYPDLVPGELERFQGKPIYANSNWPTLAAAGDDALFCSFLNLAEGVAWVDHSSGLKIFVDPYGDALAGRVRYFPRARFGAVITNGDAIVGMDDTA